MEPRTHAYTGHDGGLSTLRSASWYSAPPRAESSEPIVIDCRERGELELSCEDDDCERYGECARGVPSLCPACGSYGGRAR